MSPHWFPSSSKAYVPQPPYVLADTDDLPAPVVRRRPSDILTSAPMVREQAMNMPTSPHSSGQRTPTSPQRSPGLPPANWPPSRQRGSSLPYITDETRARLRATGQIQQQRSPPPIPLPQLPGQGEVITSDEMVAPTPVAPLRLRASALPVRNTSPRPRPLLNSPPAFSAGDTEGFFSPHAGPPSPSPLSLESDVYVTQQVLSGAYEDAMDSPTAGTPVPTVTVQQPSIASKDSSEAAPSEAEGARTPTQTMLTPPAEAEPSELPYAEDGDALVDFTSDADSDAGEANAPPSTPASHEPSVAEPAWLTQPVSPAVQPRLSVTGNQVMAQGGFVEVDIFGADQVRVACVRVRPWRSAGDS